MSLSRPIYLDHAAATPMADFVVDAMKPYFTELFYNPSSPYFPAVQVRRDYEAAKQRLAQTFGAKGDECIISAGATESINLAFHHVKGHVVSSQIEHPAVLEAAKQRKHTLIAPNSKGRVDVASVVAAIRPDTEMVSIALANSELGTVQPIRKIATDIERIRQVRREKGSTTPLLFHCDASQGFGQVDTHASRLGVDLLTLNAGKIYGPKQVALLWIKPSVNIKPTVVGGGQERGLRSGTENVAGVIGFAAAAEWVTKHKDTEVKRIELLRDQLQSNILNVFKDAIVLGDEKHRLPGHLSIAFAGIDAERIIFMVEKELLISTGSACSANKHTASHVLQAIGVEDHYIDGSLRMSLGVSTTPEAVEDASKVLINAITTEYERLKGNK